MASTKRQIGTVYATAPIRGESDGPIGLTKVPALTDESFTTLFRTDTLWKISRAETDEVLMGPTRR